MTDGKPHRPPKYVEGVYKPHYSDPSADAVLMKASMLPFAHPGALYWATTDDDGAAKGVVRREDGTPITEGADHVVGRVDDGEVTLFGRWETRLGGVDLPEPPGGGP